MSLRRSNAEQLKESAKEDAQVVLSFLFPRGRKTRNTIAQANVELDDKGRQRFRLVNARKAGNFGARKHGMKAMTSTSVPRQLVSVERRSALPEHDDRQTERDGRKHATPVSTPAPSASADVGTGMKALQHAIREQVVLARRNAHIDSSLGSDQNHCGGRRPGEPNVMAEKRNRNAKNQR